jgi:hydroxyquinol 1,2-dioxygenase
MSAASPEQAGREPVLAERIMRLFDVCADLRVKQLTRSLVEHVQSIIRDTPCTHQADRRAVDFVGP